MRTKEKLIQHLQDSGVLKTQEIARAFKKVDRAAFVPESLRGQAYEDMPLPIGLGQTISQPTTVAFMLELLSVGLGMRVLDIGFGSGWTTALLAVIVGESGAVHALELLPEVFALGRKNLEQFKFPQVRLYSQSGVSGLPEHAPYERILVSAAADAIPPSLLGQLAVGGILVIPVGSDIVHIKKESKTEYKKEIYPGFVFVPFVSS